MAEIWSGEYWASKDGVRLFMYRKRQGAPEPGESSKPVLFLVHGSTFGGPSAFDLSVPGRDDYSMMDHFARLGFDVWTIDHEGYGRSDRTDSNSDIASGAEDLRAAVEVLRVETGRDRYLWYGQSSGALRLALFAENHPARVERMILDAFVWTGEGAPTLIKRRENLEYYRTHITRPVDKEFFDSIFTRDKPGTSEPIIGEAMAAAELKYGNMVPTGTYLDMCANLPVVDPTKIECPVMITRGEHDGVATEEDLLAFFAGLPNKDKQFVIMAGMAHVAQFGLNRKRFFHTVEGFLTMPPRVDQ